MSEFGKLIAEAAAEGWRCAECGAQYEPHPDPSTEAEAKLCPACLSRDYELTLVPAYGRDYKTSEELRAAWAGGKDFRIETVASPWCGKSTSIRDAWRFPGRYAKLRFRKLERFLLLDLRSGQFVEEDDWEGMGKRVDA